MINIRNKIHESETTQIIEELTLEMFNVGTDGINFKILKMLPTDINNIMKEVNLTKMPVNTRINKLENVGLAKRIRGTGKAIPTDMAKNFLEFVNIIENKVEDAVKYKLSDI